MTKEERLLEWLGRVEGGTLLESQIVGSGLSKALSELLVQGKVEMTAHPTVKEQGGRAPAAAVRLRKYDGTEERK